jgi:hypothetical protein
MKRTRKRTRTTHPHKSGETYASIMTTKKRPHMNASETLLTWEKQKELIRFFVDGSGTIQPTSHEEANFANDLLVLILQSCKDEEDFERDIKKFTKARADELSDEPVRESDIQRIRQRYFGFLRSEKTAEEIQHRNSPLDLNAQFWIFQFLQQHLVIDDDPCD